LEKAANELQICDHIQLVEAENRSLKAELEQVRKRVFEISRGRDEVRSTKVKAVSTLEGYIKRVRQSRIGCASHIDLEKLSFDNHRLLSSRLDSSRILPMSDDSDAQYLNRKVLRRFLDIPLTVTRPGTKNCQGTTTSKRVRSGY
jgi:hypothetical protein